MRRIHLARDEKALLRGIAAFGFEGYVRQNRRPRYKAPMRALEWKNLIYARRAEDGEVVDARISEYGAEYIAGNPSLRNPVPWRSVAVFAIIALSAIIALTSLFYAPFALK